MDSQQADEIPVVSARRDGWTADRQRKFLAVLGETGSVTRACTAAGITRRSAYRLRKRPGGRAFAGAWDRALLVASGSPAVRALLRELELAVAQRRRSAAASGTRR